MTNLRQHNQAITKNIVLKSNDLQLAQNNITINISIIFNNYDSIIISIIGRLTLINNLLHAPLNDKLETNNNNLKINLK